MVKKRRCFEKKALSKTVISQVWINQFSKIFLKKITYGVGYKLAKFELRSSIESIVIQKTRVTI